MNICSTNTQLYSNIFPVFAIYTDLSCASQQEEYSPRITPPPFRPVKLVYEQVDAALSQDPKHEELERAP